MIKEEVIQRITRVAREELNTEFEKDEIEVKSIIASIVFRETQSEKCELRERENLVKTIFDSIRKLDVLQELIEDDDVTEVMVNGYDRIFIEKKGVVYEWHNSFVTKEKLDDVIQQIVSGCNRVVNESEPIVDARLSDGSRVNIVLSPPAVVGPIVTIRRFSNERFTMEKLIEKESITREAAVFLENAVFAGYNIFVSGGTSSGKTTLLNILSDFIPEDERVITIEDSAELKISTIPNLVRLETRNANSSGCEEITIRDLLRTALRMRPDRILVGEVRGAEVAEMLQIFNTGHEGSMSTAHANSCEDMITRLEAMYLQGINIPIDAIKRQISSGIDLMVHLERCRDGKRRVTQIVELDSSDEEAIILRRLFETKTIKDKYELVRENNMKNLIKFRKRGVSNPYEKRKT